MTTDTTKPMAVAPAPTRSTGSFVLSWGLISIPLSVYNGTETTAVARKEFIDGKTDHPAGRATIDKATGEILASTDSGRVVKMAEASNGAWVVLTDDDIKRCTLPKGVAEIVTFVPVDATHAYVAEDLGQVRPRAEKGHNPIAAKRAFSLLLATMRDKGVYALVKFSLRGPARHGLLTTEGNLIYIKSADQVRESLPLELMEAMPSEVALAASLIDAVGVSTPTLLDDTATRVQELVDARAAGSEPSPEEPMAPPAIDDLMATLTASIAAAKAEKSSGVY
jgi:non-homologous end joining protein Ku